MPPAIIGAKSVSKGVRARDIRMNIKELGFEKGTVMSMTLMADEQVGVRQSLSEMASLLNQVIDQLSAMGQINEQVVKQVDALRMRDEKYEASKEQ